MSTVEDVFGPVISRYTRREAIEDGILVQLSGPGCTMDQEIQDMVAEAGFKWPMAMTTTAFVEVVTPIEGEGNEKLAPCQDIMGRLWDVLWMLKCAIRSAPGGTELRFALSVVPNVPESYSKDHPPKPRQVTLKLVSGPGDNAEPVLTIMLPDED
jgi:hypothetical protein